MRRVEFDWLHQALRTCRIATVRFCDVYEVIVWGLLVECLQLCACLGLCRVLILPCQYVLYLAFMQILSSASIDLPEDLHFCLLHPVLSRLRLVRYLKR